MKYTAYITGTWSVTDWSQLHIYILLLLNRQIHTQHV